MTAVDLTAIISPCLHPGLRPRLGTDAHLLEDLGVDGVMRLAVAMELEAAYGVDVPDDDIDQWTTMADISATLERLGVACCNGIAATAQGL